MCEVICADGCIIKGCVDEYNVEIRQGRGREELGQGSNYRDLTSFEEREALLICALAFSLVKCEKVKMKLSRWLGVNFDTLRVACASYFVN